jgi:hypothetical protein
MGKCCALKKRGSIFVGRQSPKTIEEDCRTGLSVLWENAATKK